MRFSIFVMVSLFIFCYCDTDGQFSHNMSHGITVGGTDGVYGNGISVYDINEDGWDDITLCTNGDGVHTWINNGEGFDEINYLPFIEGDIKHATWVDFDNDDDPDFFVTVFGTGPHLFRNDQWTFQDITDSLHVPNPGGKSYGAAWGDYDVDGFLDVYVTNYDFIPTIATTNWLFHNNGNGAFNEVSFISGSDNGMRASFQPVWIDINNDHLPELFVINDKYHGNAAYLNQGVSFMDMSDDIGFNHEMESMSNSWSDIDHNLRPDVYISNTTEGNILLRLGDEVFENTASSDQVEVNSICWNALWMDYDHDGWDDLHVATNSPFINGNQNLLYHHNEEGFNSSNIQGDNKSVLCTAKGDFNNDGYWDFAELTQYPVGIRIYMNDGGTNHWLKVKLEGVVSNLDGIGARLHYYHGDSESVRYTFCGEGFLSQESITEILSLGDSYVLDSLIVDWPSGWKDRYYNVASNQSITCREGETYSIEIIVNGNAWICPGEVTELQAVTMDAVQWIHGPDTHECIVGGEGIYAVTAMHNLGWTAIDSIEIFEYELPPLEESHVHVSCYGLNDGVILFETPEDEFSFSINGIETSLLNEFLSLGIYNYEFIDHNGCVQSGIVNITQPDELTVDVTSDTVCTGLLSELHWDINGGTPPFTNSWKGQLPNELFPGEYEIQIHDHNSCVDSVSWAVEEWSNPVVMIESSPSDQGIELSAFVEAGTPPFLFEWNNGWNDSSFITNESGVYSLEVIDDNGCSSFDSFELIIDYVSEFSNETLLIINPVNDGLFLHTIPGQEYFIHDCSGKLLMQFVSNNSIVEIDISSYPVGLYFINGIRFVKQ